MDIIIILKLHESNVLPKFNIKLNGKSYYDSVQNVRCDHICFNVKNDVINDNNELIIEHYGKLDEHTLYIDNEIVADCSVELVSVQIDDILFDDIILYTKPYYPIYSDGYYQYAKEKNIEVTDVLYNVLNFGFNGMYKFQFERNFYKTYFNELLSVERKLHEKGINASIGDEYEEEIDYINELNKMFK